MSTLPCFYLSLALCPNFHPFLKSMSDFVREIRFWKSTGSWIFFLFEINQLVCIILKHLCVRTWVCVPMCLHAPVFVCESRPSRATMHVPKSGENFRCESSVYTFFETDSFSVLLCQALRPTSFWGFFCPCLPFYLMFSLVFISVQYKPRATWEEGTSAEELYQSWPVTMSVVNCLVGWYGETNYSTNRSPSTVQKC